MEYFKVTRDSQLVNMDDESPEVKAESVPDKDP